MKATNDSVSYRKRLATLPRLGEPLGNRDLNAHGVASNYAARLAREGWLVHLGRGAYMLPGDQLTLEGSLAFLSDRIPGLHIGGKSALSRRGVRHHVAFQDRVSLWSDEQARLPAWFLSRFECTYQVTRLFDAKLPHGFGLQPLPNGHPKVLVSVPERALLELLSDVGKTEALADVRPLVESLHSLREKVLDTLLKHTTRIKVLRLAHSLAEELSLPWAELARAHSKRKGGARWIAQTKTGERLVLKK